MRHGLPDPALVTARRWGATPRGNNEQRMDGRLIEAAPVGLGALGADLRWVRVNPALAALARMPAEELLGRRPTEIYGDDGAEMEAVVRRVAETRRAEQRVMSGV